MDSLKDKCNDTILVNSHNQFRLEINHWFVLPLVSVVALYSHVIKLLKI
jgi:hypothetical protein